MSLEKALAKIRELTDLHGVVRMDSSIVNNQPAISIEAFDSADVMFRVCYNIEQAEILLGRVLLIEKSSISKVRVISAMKECANLAVSDLRKKMPVAGFYKKK